MSLLSKFFRNSKPTKDIQPPTPTWEPEFQILQDQIIERICYYTDNEKDFVLFKNGTCVIVKDGLDETKAIEQASELLAKVYYMSQPMDPLRMDDGNTLVRYQLPVYNLILSKTADEQKNVIIENHMKALRKGEILETPNGQNKFDFDDMKALLGRCYMYMDAKDPTVIQIIRKTKKN